METAVFWGEKGGFGVRSFGLKKGVFGSEEAAAPGSPPVLEEDEAERELQLHLERGRRLRAMRQQAAMQVGFGAKKGDFGQLWGCGGFCEGLLGGLGGLGGVIGGLLGGLGAVLGLGAALECRQQPWVLQ